MFSLPNQVWYRTNVHKVKHTLYMCNKHVMQKYKKRKKNFLKHYTFTTIVNHLWMRVLLLGLVCSSARGSWWFQSIPSSVCLCSFFFFFFSHEKPGNICHLSLLFFLLHFTPTSQCTVECLQHVNIASIVWACKQQGGLFQKRMRLSLN